MMIRSELQMCEKVNKLKSNLSIVCLINFFRIPTFLLTKYIYIYIIWHRQASVKHIMKRTKFVIVSVNEKAN